MIQIFGTKKCNNTKKAQRFFKERGIKIQFIDLREREMSRGELQSVISAVGGIKSLLDDGARDRDSLALIPTSAAGGAARTPRRMPRGNAHSRRASRQARHRRLRARHMEEMARKRRCQVK